MENRLKNIYEMISECADKVENMVKSRYTGNDNYITLFDTHLIELVRKIQSIFERSEKEKDFLLQIIHYYVVCFTLSSVEESGGELDRELAGEMIRMIIIRTGVIFIMQSVSGDEISTTDTENMRRLVICMTKMKEEQSSLPEFSMFVKLLKFLEDQSLYTVEHKAGEILFALGEKVFEKKVIGEASVDQYGHPVDSNIVKMLDIPLINDVFRSLVNFNADTAMGQMLASSIPVTAENFPKLNTIVDECTDKLKIKRPYVVVTNQISGLNAMTFGSDMEPYIAVTSLLNKLMNEDEMRFVIGHECGHIAMGHVIYHTAANVFGMFSQFIPMIGAAVYSTISFPLNAWSRRSEITADRAGLICCGSLEMAKKTLIHLESAYTDSGNIDIDSYLYNSRKFLEKGILRRLGEYTANHPLTPKRIEALNLFADSEMYLRIMGKTADTEAFTDKELANKIEKIIKVL